MTLKEQRDAALAAAREIAESVKAEERAMTTEEAEAVKVKMDEVDEVDERLKGIAATDALLVKIGANKTVDPDNEVVPDETKAPSGDLAERFVKSEAFRAFREGNPSGVGGGTPIRIEAKGLGGARDLGLKTEYGSTGAPLDQTNATQHWTATQRLPGYRSQLIDYPLSFLDFITVGSTTSSYLEYAVVNAETNSAAIVAEGAVKPRSLIGTDTADAKAYTYADGFDVTNQTLADDGALVAFMQSRLERHIRSVITNVLINGATGSGQPAGILNISGTKSQAWEGDPVTTVASALSVLEDQGGEPQAIVMHPHDIWTLRLLKDGQSNYLLGNPLQQGLNPTPFGVPLVPCRQLAVGTALVGDFASVQFLEREALNILMFNQHEDYAEKNKVYVRAELRGMQLFYEPNKIVVTTVESGSSSAST